MKRTKLKDRALPTYTRGEEIFNMVSHIAGGGLSVAALVIMVVFAAIKGDGWSVVSVCIFGAALIVLYTMSSIYHGLFFGTAKKVMQVLDHCTIYFLIAGTYTPILLSAVRKTDPVCAWIVFGVEWGLAALAATLTAIDLKKYNKFSFISYIGMGWAAVFALPQTVRALTLAGFFWVLAGGMFYTVGAVFFAVGKKTKYMHSVFHLLTVLGSVCHVIAVLFYAI